MTVDPFGRPVGVSTSFEPFDTRIARNSETISQCAGHFMGSTPTLTHSPRSSHCCGYSYSPVFIHTGPTYHTTYGGRNSGKKDYTGMGVILGVVMLVGSFFAGREYGTYKTASEGLSAAKDLGRDIPFSEVGAEDETLKIKRQFDVFQGKAEGFFAQMKSDSLVRMVLKSSLVGLALIGVVGCVLEAGALVAFSGLGILALGCVWLFKAGFSSSFSSNEKERASEVVYLASNVYNHTIGEKV